MCHLDPRPGHLDNRAGQRATSASLHGAQPARQVIQLVDMPIAIVSHPITAPLSNLVCMILLLLLLLIIIEGLSLLI